KVIYEPAILALDHMQESVHQTLLERRRNATDHSEVEESYPAVRHDAQVTGMRVCVEEAVFEQLPQVEVGTGGGDVLAMYAHCVPRLYVGYPNPRHIFDCQHPPAGQAPDNSRYADARVVSEVVAEPVGVTPFANVIDFLEYGARKLGDDARPIRMAAE